MKEIWKECYLSNFYDVSNLGRVRSWKGKRVRILKSNLCSGYPSVVLRINLKPKSIAVHILVAKSFLHNPLNKPQVNHIDGIKTNNSAVNLEWVTPSENMIHAKNSGLFKTIGEENPRSKLTDLEVLYIKKSFKQNYRGLQSELARKFGVNHKAIAYIKNGGWKHVKV